MTGQQLYELSAYGYKHDPWDKLPDDLRKFYEEQAGSRRRDNYNQQGQSFHGCKSTCCGGCKEPND